MNDDDDVMMHLFTTVPHPHGHWQLQEILGKQLLNNIIIQLLNLLFIYTA